MLPHNRPRHARNPALTHRIRSARPAFLLFFAVFDGGGEGFHEGGDVGDGLGGGEGGAEGGGVSVVEAADHAGEVYESAVGADEGEEGARGG